MSQPATRTAPPPLPAFVTPMLAHPGTPFDSDDHLFEIKWDGTRMLVFRDGDGYRLVNRHRADRTAQYPELACLAQLPAGTILDGEMVVLQQGRPDFGRLLSRDLACQPLKIQLLARSLPATYVVFDLLYARRRSLLSLPLHQRRTQLCDLVGTLGHPQAVFSEGIVGAGRAFFRQVCATGLEGVVAKQLDSRYRPGWTVGAAVINLGNGTQVWAPVSPGFKGPPYVNFGNSIVDSLVLPGSLVPAMTNSLQVEFSNAQPHTALLTAFGGDWRYLGQVWNDAGAGPHGGTLATLAVPRMHYFMIEGTNVPPLEAPVPIPPLPRWGVEQISFDLLTADAPEPAGLPLSTLGALGLLACFALARLRAWEAFRSRGRGQRTTMAYNTTGDLTSVQDALGKTTTMVWSSALKQSETDPLNHN